jgi:proteasome accessory factor A
MSEYTTFLKVGTSLLLRMLEDPGVVLRDMTLENPIRAIREISHDITGRRRVRLANGREVGARDPAEYLERAARYAETMTCRPRRSGAGDVGARDHPTRGRPV